MAAIAAIYKYYKMILLQGNTFKKILENKKKFDAGQKNGARGDDKLKTFFKASNTQNI